MLQKCCGLNLYTCGKILGWFHVIVSVIGFLGSGAFFLAKEYRISRRNEEYHDWDFSQTSSESLFTLVFASLQVVAFFLQTVASIAFIYGIKNKRPTLLLPLLGFDILIFFWAVLSYLALQGLLLPFIVFNLFCGFWFYVLYVMFSVYKKMRSDEKAKDASHQVEAQGEH